MQGYIKLYRQLQDHPFWKEKRKFSRAEAWIDLLMLANHSDSKIIVRGIILDLAPGDLFWSQEEMAIRWHWSKTKVNSFLKMLENQEQISYKVGYRIGITSIVNWHKFQQSDTTNQDTNQDTERVQKSYKPGSNKNVKKEKNVNNVKYAFKDLEKFKENKKEVITKIESLGYFDVENYFNKVVNYCEISKNAKNYLDLEKVVINWLGRDNKIRRVASSEAPKEDLQLKRQKEVDLMYSRFCTEYMNKKFVKWNFLKDFVQNQENKQEAWNEFRKLHPVEFEELKKFKNNP